MKSTKPSLIAVFITLMVEVVGTGIIIPVYPAMLMEISGDDLGAVSLYAGYIFFLYYLLQFLCIPLLGALSDRFGRRPLLLLAVAGSVVSYFLAAAAPTLIWMFISITFVAVTASTFANAAAYIADITDLDSGERAQRFGVLGAAAGLGIIVGPLLGGWLGVAYGPRMAFVVAGGLATANLLFRYVFVAESLVPEERRAFQWARANPVGNLLELRKFPLLFGLLSAYALVSIGGDARGNAWTFFTMEQFQWDAQMVGYSLSALGLAGAISQGLLIRLLIRLRGPYATVYLSLSCYFLGFVGISFAASGWMMYPMIVLVAVGTLVLPTLQGIMSEYVPANAQGELQGALYSLNALVSIGGPLIMTRLFYYFTAAEAPVYLPGAPFLFGAVLLLGSLVVAAISLSGPKVDAPT